MPKGWWLVKLTQSSSLETPKSISCEWVQGPPTPHRKVPERDWRFEVFANYAPIAQLDYLRRRDVIFPPGCSHNRDQNFPYFWSISIPS